VSVDQDAVRGSRAEQPGDVHRTARPDPQGVREGSGVKPALFSANSEGACPNCNGAGVIYTDLAMMAGVATTCEGGFGSNAAEKGRQALDAVGAGTHGSWFEREQEPVRQAPARAPARRPRRVLVGADSRRSLLI
jgi:DnaJ-class molecular chaperone